MIITISRETGSGGHTVGKLLAEKLGYPFFDKEIVAAVAKEMNIDEQLILDNGESMSDQDYIDLSSGFIPHYRQADIPYDAIKEAQDMVIHKIAERGSCVIVGRGADCILKDRTDVFHVFVYASMEHRVKRVQRHEGVTGQEERIRRELAHKDRSRATYYRYFTNREWGKAANYNLSIDTTIFTKTQSADLIIAAVEMLKEKNKGLAL